MPKRIYSAASPARKAWVKPDVRQIEAGEAEVFVVAGPDLGVFS